MNSAFQVPGSTRAASDLGTWNPKRGTWKPGMATVWIPSLLRELCGGERVVEAPGRTVRQVIENLEQRCPGIRERLTENGELRPELAVSVDGTLTEIGLLQPVGERSEVHIVPALGGGADLPSHTLRAGPFPARPRHAGIFGTGPEAPTRGGVAYPARSERTRPSLEGKGAGG